MIAQVDGLRSSSSLNVSTTRKETILKGWEKTKLSDGFDLDEMMANQDFEEEFLLSEKMTELMTKNEPKEEPLMIKSK